MHAGSIGVEDAGDLDLDAMLAVIIEKESLRTTLPLIVTGPRTYRIYVPSIRFRLRMDVRITVNFRGGSLKDWDSQAFRQPQHVDGSVDTGLSGRHGIILIMNWGSRARQIVDLIHLHIERKRDVVTEKLEIGIL